MEIKEVATVPKHSILRKLLCKRLTTHANRQCWQGFAPQISISRILFFFTESTQLALTAPSG